jgi:hypothetical protein
VSQEDDSRFTLIVLALFAIVALLVVVGSGGFRSSDDRIRSVLQRAGYSEIEVGGWSPMTCADDDLTSTSFQARGPNGKVSGTVCCGVLKGCTIRW